MTSRIEDLANHAANMVNILEFWEDLGRPKPSIFVKELERTSEELMKLLKERETNETGSRDLFETGGAENGTSAKSSESVRGSGDRASWLSPRREIVRGAGIGGADGEGSSTSSRVSGEV